MNRKNWLELKLNYNSKRKIRRRFNSFHAINEIFSDSSASLCSQANIAINQIHDIFDKCYTDEFEERDDEPSEQRFKIRKRKEIKCQRLIQEMKKPLQPFRGVWSRKTFGYFRIQTSWRLNPDWVSVRKGGKRVRCPSWKFWAEGSWEFRLLIVNFQVYWNQPCTIGVYRNIFQTRVATK